MLSLTNIKKYYDRKLALDIPELNLSPGIYWAKGPNGSGKTTLLRSIAGLLPFEGTISFNGIDQRSNPVLYRKFVSWADAEPLFPNFLTGSDLISFYRSVRRAAQEESDKLITLFEMTDYISQKTSTYSSGMMKKVSLVLALLGKTPLIILDEPMITLDKESLACLSQLILSKSGNDGVTFLLSSHTDTEQEIFTRARILEVSNRQVCLQ